MTALYERGQIYRINCPDDYYYIGSTISNIGRIITTMKGNASDPKKQCNLYRYFQSIGWNHLTIECIEVYPCQSKKELNERELYHIHLDDLHCLNNGDIVDNLPIENKEEQSTIIGFIYKLVCPDGYYYISCTITPLIHRIQNHKQHAKTSKLRVYAHINTIGWDDIKIELIETYTCFSKKELITKMNSYIENHNDDSYCLNDEIKKKGAKNEKKENKENKEEIVIHEMITEEPIQLDDDTILAYKHGQIYKLQCTDGHFYIGSTTKSLAKRLRWHKDASVRGTNRLYTHINSIGWDNVHIELIEKYSYHTINELRKQEDMYIKQHINEVLCLNFNRAQLTIEEKIEQNRTNSANYRTENKETINQKFAEYRKKNAPLLAEKQRAYAKKNKEKITVYKKTYDETHKEQLAETYKAYRLKNKEKIVKRQREWEKKKKEENAEAIAADRQKRKEERQEQSKKRMEYDNTINTCECGGTYQNYRKNRHLVSKKHITFITPS